MPWKILVLDDDADSLNSIAESLRHALPGSEVQTSSSPHEAIRSMQRDRPDALVADYRMPSMDGLALADVIRSMMPRLPVVLLTAFPDNALEDSVGKGPIKAVLYKPFSAGQLADVLRTALAG